MAKATQPIRTKKLVDAIVAGKSISEAGMIATGSNSLSSGAAQASRMLKREDVKQALAEAFEKHGITLDAAVAPIGKALKADEIELQLKGSDRALKLMGLNGQNDNGTTNYNFINVANSDKAKYFNADS